MGHKYTVEALHPVRHMEEYIAEIKAGDVSPYRQKQLKERFANVKKLAYDMYKDAYTFIMQLDGEMMQSPKELWKHDLQISKSFSLGFDNAYGNYSDENLHPIRHLDTYIQEMESGPSTERVKELKSRFGTVLMLSVNLYYDAERLICLLD